MSMLGEDFKDDMYFELKEFVQEHSLEELMDVLHSFFEYVKLDEIKIKKED